MIIKCRFYDHRLVTKWTAPLTYKNIIEIFTIHCQTLLFALLSIMYHEISPVDLFLKLMKFYTEKWGLKYCTSKIYLSMDTLYGMYLYVPTIMVMELSIIILYRPGFGLKIRVNKYTIKEITQHLKGNWYRCVWLWYF